MSPKPSHPRQHDFMGGLARREAGDFTTDRRVLLLIGMALVIGTGGAVAAWFLVKLIALVTNFVWFGRIGTQDAKIADIAFSAWMVLIPVFGGLVIGLMARFGRKRFADMAFPRRSRRS